MMNYNEGSSNHQRSVPRGLYLIADCNLLAVAHVEDTLHSVISNGVNMVQFRNKEPLTNDKRHLAQRIQTICHQYRIPFLVNDDVELALTLNADGVHLGTSDTSIKTARKVLGENIIIGASCYDSINLAERACADSADYVAFGAVFPTTTKKDTVRISLDKLRRYADTITKPVCAIGGITANNVHKVWSCGVDMVAIASGILGAQSPYTETLTIAERIDY